jgi:hypothetical protein
MKKTIATIVTLIWMSQVSGSSFDLPDFKMDLNSKNGIPLPKMELRVPEVDHQPFSWIPNETIDESQEGMIWKKLMQMTPEAFHRIQAAGFEIHRAEPFPAIILVPDNDIDEQMVHQPSADFEYNMPIVKPDFDLHPLNEVKGNQPKTKP